MQNSEVVFVKNTNTTILYYNIRHSILYIAYYYAISFKIDYFKLKNHKYKINYSHATTYHIYDYVRVSFCIQYLSVKYEGIILNLNFI